MAVTIGIGHLLDGTDSSDSNMEDEALQNFGDLIAPVHAVPSASPSGPEVKQPESKEPELSDMALLQQMYRKDEEAIQQRKNADQSQRRRSTMRGKVKVKIKVGSEVDIFSASQDKWLPGVVNQIQGDKLCIQYGNKIKWLAKKSQHIKFNRAARSSSLHQPPTQLQQSHSHHAPAQPQPSPSAPSAPPMSDMEMHSHPEKMVPVAFSDASSLNAYGHGGSGNAAPAFQAPAPPNMQQAHSHNSHFQKDHSHFNPPEIKRPDPNQAHKGFGIHRASIHMEARHSVVKPPSKPKAQVKRNSMADNVFVYTVEFDSRSMGVALIPYKDGNNCLVHECLSVFAQQQVDPGSMVCSVNNVSVLNKSYDEIHNALRAALQHPPFKVTFRARTDGLNYKQINNVNERGTLYVKLIAGAQLKRPASYATVEVGRAQLKSKELKKSEENPQFDDTLCFKNFRCDHGKSAIIRVYGHKSLGHDKEIGHASYPLPVKFNELQNDTLELKNSKNHLHGILTVHTMVKRK